MTSFRLLRWSALPALCLLALSPLFAQTLSTQQFTVPAPLKISSGRGYTASEFNGIQGVADFNRDGRNDILSTYSFPNGSSGIAILFRNGDGSYTPELTNMILSPAGMQGIGYSAAFQIADVNGDGIPDVISVLSPPQCPDKDPDCNAGGPNGDAFLYVYLGNGNGTFRTSMSTDLGNTFAHLDAVADLNKGGKPELLIDESVEVSSSTYTVWANQGAGKFAPSSVSFSGYYSLFVSGDFNGDGYADLAASNGSGIQILLNNKGTGFTLGASPVFMSRVTALAVGDLNGDHRLDIVAADVTGGGHILLGKGNGTFVQSAFNTGAENVRESAPIPSSIQIADLNGDGHPDISFIAGDYGNGPILNVYLEVFAGNGKGSVSSLTAYTLGSAGTDARLANLNGTGKPDVLLSSYEGGYQVARNNGKGSFYAPRQNNTITGSTSIVTADFNGDGIDDVAVVGGNAPFSFTAPTSVIVYTGTGKGYFSASHVYPIGQLAGAIASGDVNGDGIPDLVVARSALACTYQLGACPAGSTDLSVLLGNGDGTFRPAMNYSVLGAPATGDTDNFIQLADVNHDGKLDLIGDWGVALGKGNGSFNRPTALPLPAGYITQMAAGDFNRDGTVDLAVGRNLTYPDSGTLYVLLGNGKGSFTVKGQAQLANTAAMGSVAVGDMNRDGAPDLVFFSSQVSSAVNKPADLTVRLGNGDGTFGSPISYAFAPLPLAPTLGAPGPYTGQMLISDFNRDGIPDLLYLGAAPLPGPTAPGPEGPTAPSSLMLLRGTGGGHLSLTPQYYITGLTWGAVVDLNGDGAPDVVGTTFAGVTRLMNTGSRK